MRLIWDTLIGGNSSLRDVILLMRSTGSHTPSARPVFTSVFTGITELYLICTCGSHCNTVIIPLKRLTTQISIYSEEYQSSLESVQLLAFLMVEGISKAFNDKENSPVSYSQFFYLFFQFNRAIIYNICSLSSKSEREYRSTTELYFTGRWIRNSFTSVTHSLSLYKRLNDFLIIPIVLLFVTLFLDLWWLIADILCAGVRLQSQPNSVWWHFN